MSEKKILDLILKEIKEIKTDVSELKADVSELNIKTSNLENDMSELKITVNRIDNNTDNMKQEMEQNFDYTNKMLDQAFEKISENMQEKEKVDTIFNFLKKQTQKPKINSFRRNTKEELIA